MIFTCRQCQRTLAPSGPPIIGESFPAKLLRISELLASHLQQAHPQSIEQAGVYGQTLIALILLCQFDTDNKEIQQHRAVLAKRLYQTIGRRLTDEQIVKRLEQMAIGPEHPEWFTLDAYRQIRALLKEIRDYFTFADVQEAA